MNAIEELDIHFASGELDFRIRYTLDYARNNLTSDLSLAQLARINGISSWHLCRLFTAGLGLSPVHCIKLLRLRAAADLLAKTALSVKEIGTAVGINNQSHFVRDFRVVFGQSPKQYRLKRRADALAVVGNANFRQ
jgi:AraC family transcriptional regulator